MSRGYMVEIAAGLPRQWGPKVGWDAIHPTQAEAEACAERARAHDGWEARVVEVDMAPPPESVAERLAREQAELRARLAAL